MTVHNPLQLRGRQYHTIADAAQLEKKFKYEIKDCTFRPEIHHPWTVGRPTAKQLHQAKMRECEAKAKALERKLTALDIKNRKLQAKQEAERVEKLESALAMAEEKLQRAIERNDRVRPKKAAQRRNGWNMSTRLE